VLVALYGPTSSGKTALSVELARRIERDLGRPVVIVSADSRQVYRYMDIGTSKTTRAEMGGIRHEMIDIVEPVRKPELEEYARLARPHLRTDGVALIVGGTGVYVKALLDGWTLDGVGQARDALRRDFPRSMAADAYAMLRRLDKTARVHPNNYEAVINALAARMAGPPGAAPAAHMVLGLDPGAAVIDRQTSQHGVERIRELVDAAIWPQVRAADAGRRDADDRVRRFDEPRLLALLDPHVARAVHHRPAHQHHLLLVAGTVLVPTVPRRPGR